MVRICTGLVCVRSTMRRLVAARPRMQIEGVLLLPSRVLRRDVELGEVVVVRLDVGAFGDGEAHVAEDLDDLVVDLRHGMDTPIGQRTEPHRQGDVDLLGGEPLSEGGLLQIGLARVERVAHARLDGVDGLPEGLALVGGNLPSSAINSETLALAAERCDTHLLERRQVTCNGNLRDQRLFERSNIGMFRHYASRKIRFATLSL